ncbi:Rubredoxin-like superfamily [Chlorella sorokiniana]|uniref:Rubredoxin-like superfamily n=1 Tax=Chlorella sorokiniana TaxID=3076 RepID=A0A2P6TWV9_CHLSO|nr:Rubredoxin-like superfamily [Chlorella sorokiniana]|eukprot:PRW58553.1 Rubredoxin-like superfamily [Chlorella sorokiniana]
MALALAKPRPAVAGAQRAAMRGTAVQARPVLPERRAAARAPLAVSARATKQQTAYICIDCGYIYDGSEGPFDKLPSSYRCPVCSAPKRRFKPYAAGGGKNDAKSMNARYERMQSEGGSKGGSKVDGGAFLAAGVAAAAALAGLYFFLSSQYN